MIQITINAGVLKIERDYQELFKVALTKDEAEVFQMAGSSVSAADSAPGVVQWPPSSIQSHPLPNSAARPDGPRQWALANVVPGTVACFDIGEYTKNTEKWAAYFWLKAAKGENPLGALKVVDKLNDQMYAQSEIASGPRVEFVIGDKVPVERPLVLEVHLMHYDNSQHPDLLLQTGTRWRA